MHGNRIGGAAIIAAAALAWLSCALTADDLAGPTCVLDGDTIAIGSQNIRF
jgi:hypothetical protein